jgi:hypothetical protein
MKQVYFMLIQTQSIYLTIFVPSQSLQLKQKVPNLFDPAPFPE